MKKQRNVQEQLSVKKNAILKEARFWRQYGIPEVLEKVFREKGIDIDKSIVLSYDQDFPGISTDEGIVLTPGEVFCQCRTACGNVVKMEHRLALGHVGLR